jgi:DDE superfamily endonuclease
MVAWAVEPERLLFVDECGVHTSLAPIYGYAPRDERLHLPVPRNRGKNTTLLSSMTTGGMGPSLAVEGATTARVFETYVEKVLVPSLRAGQIVVMDNLSAHRPRRIRELIEQQGCKVLYLPAYSPDYKWDEKAEIMLRREPTMVSLENRSRSQADPQEGGLQPCPSTTHPSTAH